MSQMTIGKKLFLSFGAALVLTLVVSCLALESYGTLGAATAQTSEPRPGASAPADLRALHAAVGASRPSLARAPGKAAAKAAIPLDDDFREF